MRSEIVIKEAVGNAHLGLVEQVEDSSADQGLVVQKVAVVECRHLLAVLDIEYAAEDAPIAVGEVAAGRLDLRVLAQLDHPGLR